MDGRFPPLPVRRLDIGQPANPAAANGTAASGGGWIGQAAPAAQTDETRYQAKATEAALKFESFFIAQTLHKMRDATKALADDDSIYKNSINSDMLDMADNMVADQLAGRRAFGIADAILRQLTPPPQPSPAENFVLPKKNSD